MTFSMTLDTTHRALTGIVLGIFVVALCVIPFAPAPGKVALMVVIVGAALLSFAFAPLALELTDTEIRVLRRLAPPVHLPLATVRGIGEGPHSGSGPGLGFRVFGNGGFFGTYGLYWKKGLGIYRRYGTRLDASMLITRTAGWPIVVTPDDGALFRNAVLAKLPKS
jgi:hypothetical protein